ncbi:glycerophosphodiester phosphodiesterase [Aquabacterium humicola]|uniref:glycerophosphodiester phosphodiesterase n=1 Tax=Aquabacterium humicola TaxID=3237377 RepID=UPI002543D43D|nr:glycerophosphodiester phosphodiesterase [Rubrivivax pictus]
MRHPVRYPLRRIVVLLALCTSTLAVQAFDLQGHRGARGLAPENTLAAFRTAIAVGVDTLELDVHLSADGVPMVVHDPALNRDLTRDAQGEWLAATGPLIGSVSAAELQSKFRLGRARPASSIANTFPEQKPSDAERLPRLSEVLALMREPGREALRANIEIKLNPKRPDDTPAPEAIVRAVLAVLRDAGVERRVTLQGFDWRALRIAQQLAPRIPTAYLSAQRPNFDTVSDGTWSAGFDLKTHGSLPKMVKAAGGAIWSPNFNDLSPALIAEAHALGLQVLPWTVNQAEDMARLIDWGVDGLITDYPDRARRVMADKKLPLPPAGR